MKKRKKRILSRSGVEYKLVLDDELKQVKIVWVSSKGLLDKVFTKRKKRKIQEALDSKNLNLEIVKEDKESITYKCPKQQQRKVRRTLAGS